MPDRWKRDQNILVTEAHALGAIGVIRSLGRAGYRVVATSWRRDALGFRSRFAAAAEHGPAYRSPEFILWLRACLERHRIGLIVPSEAFLLAIRPVFDELAPMLPLPERAETVYRAFSKVAVAQALLAADADPAWRTLLPPSVVIRRGEPLPDPDVIENLGAPFYLKSDLALSRGNREPLTQRCTSVTAALHALAAHRDEYEAILVQGFVPGVKAAAAFCLDANGDVVTRSAVLAHRTTPHHGGMMSLRESWRHERMEETGLAWLRHLDWRGVAMVECKWDPQTDRFWLIEINARYWGYLHLDLYAGVDVPRLQADRFFGIAPDPVATRMLGVRCRHAFPGDAGWLLSRLRDRELSVAAKVASVIRFVVDFADFSCHADLHFPGDRHLFWIEAARFLREAMRSARYRLFGQRRAAQ